jgi:hypothetical protein
MMSRSAVVSCGNVRFEPAIEPECPVIHISGDPIEGNRYPNISTPPRKTWWHDTNHRSGLLIQQDGSTDHTRVLAEIALKDFIAQNDNPR